VRGNANKNPMVAPLKEKERGQREDLFNE
jgi:hypothetical protein